MDCFQDIIHGNAVTDVNRICFKYHTGLSFGQFASLDVIRVVCHAHL